MLSKMSEDISSLSLSELEQIPGDMYPEIMSLEDATIYHTAAWHRFLARSCGWHVSALVAYDQDGSLIWCLPFVRKKRLGLKRVNVCLPLSHRVGPVYRKDAGPLLKGSLHAREGPIEIHEHVSAPGLYRAASHTVTELNLAKHRTIEELRKSLHKSTIQRKISKAEKSGCFDLVEGTARQHFDAMEQLQLETRRRQGSPTYPSGSFAAMWDELRQEDRVHLHLAYLDGRPVSGILFFHFRDTAIYGYGASVDDRSLWRQGVNQLTMWSAVREAYEKGLTRVDFGTTPISQPDLRIYKERWGAQSHELVYTYSDEKASQSQPGRSGMTVKIASWVLRRLPKPLFARISPFMLRAVV